jgi:tRNA-dihydrouridine synthase 2
LLENQDVLIAILEKLKGNLSIPVSCKIRLLDPKDNRTSHERTLDLLKRIESTGVSAIGIHCRFTHERPRQPGHWEVFDELIQELRVPVIANGDIWTLKDLGRLKNTTGSLATAFMIARGAQANVSCFRKEGQLTCHEVMTEYIKLAILYDMPYPNCKYTLMQMAYPEEERIDFQKNIVACRSYDQLAELFAIQDYLQDVLKKRKEKAEEIDNQEQATKKIRLEVI